MNADDIAALYARITELERNRDDWRTRAFAAEDERDVLQAKLDRLERVGANLAAARERNETLALALDQAEADPQEAEACLAEPT